MDSFQCNHSIIHCNRTRTVHVATQSKETHQRLKCNSRPQSWNAFSQKRSSMYALRKIWQNCLVPKWDLKYETIYYSLCICIAIWHMNFTSFLGIYFPKVTYIHERYANKIIRSHWYEAKTFLKHEIARSSFYTVYGNVFIYVPVPSPQ